MTFYIQYLSQLLAITMDEVNNKLLDLYAYENFRKGERFVDEVYNANTSVIVNDSKIFRFECVSILFSNLVPYTRDGNMGGLGNRLPLMV